MDDSFDGLVLPDLERVDDAFTETEPVLPLPGLEAVVTPVLSYALAHNRVPVVHSVTITGVEKQVRGATLLVALRDAQGPIGPPAERLIDLEPGRETVLTGLEIRLDPAAMFQIEEQRPGVIAFDLFDGDALLASTVAEVQVLASNQWLARPLELGLELLAAFVMPNHPSIARLTAEAATRLEQTTGSDSMPGYQAGPERADEIVRAITEAMHARGIRYVNPPASWSDLYGQKVRNPEEVLEHGSGTCLDTTVVLAAALEYAGIRPLLWVVDGHAFLGYWRLERSLDAAAITDVGDLVNLIDLGAIGLIETTAVTNDALLDFPALTREIQRTWFSGSFGRVLGVTDVYRARRDSVLPLPARRTLEDGQVVVTEYRPAAMSASVPAPVPAAAREPESAPRTNRTPPPPRVAHWKNALLDLSLRNRLINFTDYARLQLTVPNERIGKLEDEISGGAAFTLLPGDRIGAMQRVRELESAEELPADLLIEQFDERRSIYTNLSSAAYLTKMRNLAYQARTLIEETGANNLYLAFGSLIWSIDGRTLRSPLILVPVTITPVSRQGHYRVSLDESGASTPNYCLLEKLRQTHGIEIPELENPAEDGSGIHLEQTLLATRHALLGKGLGFRVEASVDLAILQFAKFRLWKDMDEHWETFEANSLVRHLIRTPFEPFADPITEPIATDLDDLAAKSPMPADSSQLAAVAEAVGGKTFVLEGPPGTGKSQTITNLLTRAIAAGQRVLFVAEKRAALDVVQRRLDEVGLGLFSLDLHDRHSKPNEVRRQIKSALEAVFDIDEQGFVDTLSRLETARRRLDAYPRRLHEKNPAGHSYYSARTQELTIDDDVPALPIPVSWPAQVTSEAVGRLRSLLNTLTDVSDAARPSASHPWGFIDAKQPSGLNADAILAAARAFDVGIEELPSTGSLAEVLRSIRQPEAFTALSAVLSAPELDRLDLLDEVCTGDWSQSADLALRESTAFGEAPRPVFDIVTPEALKLDLIAIDRQAREASESGFFGRKGRLKAAADQLTPVLKPGATIDLKHLGDVTRPLAETAATAREVRDRLEAVPGMTLPAEWNPLLPEHRQWVEQRILWLRWNGPLVDPNGPADRTEFVRALRALYAERPSIDPATAQRVAKVAGALQRLVTEAAVTGEDLLEWSGDAGLIVQWQSTSIARRLNDETGATLRDWFVLLEWVEPLREEGLLGARKSLLTGVVPADDAVRAFARGVAEASRRERATSTGLEPFDDRAHERRIRQFVEASSAIREHLITAIPREVVASRAFNPTAESGRVGRLTRELNRQRGGMGVRTLLDTFGDLITAIMPCVLVSPDSVARFFPAKSGLFDIVVFDEASQIRVADAIGAMGRGRSVVVVGDSKQMPPTAFAEPVSAIDEAIDGDAAEDEESILTECVNAQVPRHWLSWHYRSQDEALIAFSNQQYYEQKLSSFPAPVHGAPDAGPAGHGISLVRVDGVFHRNRTEGPHRTNPIEATAIIKEIERRFSASPDTAPSIGVVTFNIQQRNLIEEMLRDSGNQRVLDALEDPDGLFVKNLENVQGDERDSIFFSTAFSVNDRGVLPLNFGPLNRAGGERRLNVAITRARRQVVVFSSFDPEQLRAEETSSVGVKHLRAYLDIAAHGTRQLPADGRSRQSIDRHRDEIAAALRSRGYAVRTDVGLSEFRIDLVLATADQPDRPVMAVLLDGEAWASRRTVGDRDGLPQDVLTRMLGWPAVERIWMPAWLADREAELDDLDRMFDAAVERLESGESPAPDAHLFDPGPEDVIEPAVSDDEAEIEELRAQFASLTSSPAHVEPALHHANLASDSLEEPLRLWNPRRLGGVEVLDLLPAPRQTEKVASALRDVVETEGPIHYDRLTRLVAGAYGLGRVSGARHQSILAALPSDLRSPNGEPFAWPTRMSHATWRGYRRGQGGQQRPIEQICREEIVNAMAAIAYGAAGIDADELKREALTLFGGRRLTPAIETMLTDALDFGIANGRLTIDEHGVIRRG